MEWEQKRISKGVFSDTRSEDVIKHTLKLCASQECGYLGHWSENPPLEDSPHAPRTRLRCRVSAAARLDGGDRGPRTAAASSVGRSPLGACGRHRRLCGAAALGQASCVVAVP